MAQIRQHLRQQLPQYSYDKNGNRTRLDTQLRKLVYSYDELNRLISLGEIERPSAPAIFSAAQFATGSGGGAETPASGTAGDSPPDWAGRAHSLWLRFANIYVNSYRGQLSDHRPKRVSNDVYKCRV